jgi:hypothetical protein
MNQVKDFLDYIFKTIRFWVIIQPWEQGIKVRLGKKITKLDNGMYFKIPYIDSIYVQETRLRVVGLPVQTLTTKDGKTLTITGAVGTNITDVSKLYNTLYHAETTIRNIAMSEISAYVYSKNSSELNLSEFQNDILEKLKQMDYGLNFEYFKLTNFAFVRSYRLIQDSDWNNENFSINTKR